MPCLPGIEHAISSDGFFELEDLPKKCAVVGAGYIAVELAGPPPAPFTHTHTERETHRHRHTHTHTHTHTVTSGSRPRCPLLPLPFVPRVLRVPAGILAALGSDVSLMIRKDEVLRTFDNLVRDKLMHEMVGAGINVVHNSGVNGLAKCADGRITMDYTTTTQTGSSVGKEDHTMEGLDAVLMAIGRDPVTDLGLEHAVRARARARVRALWGRRGGCAPGAVLAWPGQGACHPLSGHGLRPSWSPP